MFYSKYSDIKIKNFVNPHQNDQGQKGPWCFQMCNALKCLSVKNSKIPNPPLGSYLFNEHNFSLIK